MFNLDASNLEIAARTNETKVEEDKQPIRRVQYGSGASIVTAIGAQRLLDRITSVEKRNDARRKRKLER